MARKKIAVITARADDSEQKEILYGIAEAAFSADADTVVYSNIYNRWVEDATLNFENVIYSLFEPNHFNGVIITAEAFRDVSILNSVIKKIKSANLAAVVIGAELEGFASVYSNDEADMELMTEHVIDHGIKDIDILTGFKDSDVAKRRANGCISALKKRGIAFDESKLHYGNFWSNSGEELARRYISKELPLPRAVICTNDLMAQGLCDTLVSAGISVPRDLSVTGYDYTGGRIYHLPILTTMRRNRRKLGHDAVNKLLGCEYSAEDDGRFLSGDSCPCGTVQSQLSNELRQERLSQYQTIISNTAQFSSHLTACKTLAEYTAVLSKFYYLLNGAQSLFLCLDSEWGSPKFSGEDFLCCKVTEDEACDTPIKFSQSSLPPVFSDECAMYYFSPLCFQTRQFGYTVLKYSYPSGYDFTYRDWNKTVADTLEFLRMKNDIHYLKQCQRASSFHDILTGFYNLREFKQIAKQLPDNPVYALKLGFASEGEFIFGENYRNDIVSEVAGAIKKACSKHEVCCRANDDTFLILGRPDDDTLSEKLDILLFNTGGICDERKAVISRSTLVGGSVSQICSEVSTISEQDVFGVKKRMTLPHYTKLLELRKSVITVPQKAPTLSEASRSLCISEGHFRLIYRECFGVSYNQDLINAKLMKACFLLLTTAMSVYAVAINCGYNDEKFFARQFGKYKNCSPMEYRKKFADINDV